MAPGRAEADFGLQGWIDTLELKQIFLIFSVEQPTITSFRLIWFEQKNSKTKISLLDLKVAPIQTEGN